MINSFEFFSLDCIVRHKGLCASRCCVLHEAAKTLEGLDLPEETLLVQNQVVPLSQAMRGTLPWRGAKEKHPDFLQSIIESLTDEGDIVFDWTASIGMNFTLRLPYYVIILKIMHLHFHLQVLPYMLVEFPGATLLLLRKIVTYLRLF